MFTQGFLNLYAGVVSRKTLPEPYLTTGCGTSTPATPSIGRVNQSFNQRDLETERLLDDDTPAERRRLRHALEIQPGKGSPPQRGQGCSGEERVDAPEMHFCNLVDNEFAGYVVAHVDDHRFAARAQHAMHLT